jgi:hypothetical protein
MILVPRAAASVSGFPVLLKKSIVPTLNNLRLAVYWMTRSRLCFQAEERL